MNLKSSLIACTLALIVGVLAGYWVCNLQWEASESRMNESQAKQETERLEKAMEENRNLKETVSQMQIQTKKENDNEKRKYDDLLARINRGTAAVRADPGNAGGDHFYGVLERLSLASADVD